MNIEAIPWYVTRAAGTVSLVLLTLTICLGLLTVARLQAAGWPRFLTAQFHRNVALLSVVFVFVHVIIAVLDPFTSLGFASALIPFSSSYRQLWLGLGGVSMYLVAAVIVTSLLRDRIGQRTWRLVHWAAYLAWPMAVLHGLGTGTDAVALWNWALNAICIVLVVACFGWRMASRRNAALQMDDALPVGPQTGFR